VAPLPAPAIVVGMPRGPRTRTRLLTAFLAIYVVLATVGGGIAWRLPDRLQADQAAERARNVAQLSSFFHSERIRQQVEELTGYRIEVHALAPEPRDGTVHVRDRLGRTLVVDYRNANYVATRRAVLVGTLSFIGVGVLLVAAVSWLMAANLARPVELLAKAARRLGGGDLERPVPQVGGGEIRDLAVDFEAMRRRLVDLDRENRQKERLSTLGTFTAVIAHEIRNPLSAVRLTLQMMAKRRRDDPMVTGLLDELERLDLIVDELLAFSKGVTAECVDCDLDEVAWDVARLLARQADHAGVHIRVDGQARVTADPARMRQLLLNLVLNAIQAQHDGGGEVRVRIADDGIVVEDDGPGVPAERQPTLFDAFASSRSGGTGLGLHISRAIAEAHGAHLVYREDGNGHRFELTGLEPAGRSDQNVLEDDGGDR